MPNESKNTRDLLVKLSGAGAAIGASAALMLSGPALASSQKSDSQLAAHSAASAKQVHTSSKRGEKGSRRGHAHAKAKRGKRASVEVFGRPPAKKLLVEKMVSLTGPKVSRFGGSCAGDTAAGALQRATGGRWSGKWDAEYSDYEVIGIDGLKLPFNSKSQANWYWSIWVNGREASAGVCGLTLKSGEKLIFKPACYGKACPPAGKAAGVTDPADRRKAR